MRLKIGTYNVHGWVDKDHISNLDRVVEVISRLDPDILCLQEIYPCWELPCVVEFMRKTRFVHLVRWGECAVLSKQNILLQEVGKEDGMDLALLGGCYHKVLPAGSGGYSYNRPRYTCVRVLIGSDPSVDFYLTCIHLSPKYSDMRLEELERIHSDLAPLFSNSEPQIWLGDFNSLTESDYVETEWNRIVEQRTENGRQPPCNKLTKEIENLKFSDCWKMFGKPEPRGTSKFDTRVDYVYGYPSFLKDWSLVNFIHYACDASDHNFVMAEFQHL